jgi:hypothetical protein
MGVSCSFTMSWKPTMDEALQVGICACLPPAGLYEPRRLWWPPLRFSSIPPRAQRRASMCVQHGVERPETVVEDRKRSAKM